MRTKASMDEWMKNPTGRRLSEKPAPQNIPLRTELGKQLSDVFTREKVLEEAPKLVDVDYEALELLVLASMFQR